MTGAALISLWLFSSCSSNDANPDPNPDAKPATATIPSINYSVTGSFPHDTSSYTEALLFYNGQVLESGGNYGSSKLFQYDLKSGKASKTIKLDPKFFGEGACVFRDTIYQMTWKEKTVFVYDKNFKKIKELA
ncbi:MAG: glutaminyl-peptide cyclotransferase, partial [Flaviaesturariibacter sp.]|nr:glutaminyl-peptide cyclotransferase [Flaviaesturariibacter sp.]